MMEHTGLSVAPQHPEQDKQVVNEWINGLETYNVNDVSNSRTHTVIYNIR